MRNMDMAEFDEFTGEECAQFRSCVDSWGVPEENLWEQLELFVNVEKKNNSDATADPPFCGFCGSYLDRKDPFLHLGDEHFERHHAFKRMQVRKTPGWPRSWANFSLF